MIQVKNIHKYYGDLHVLKGVNLEIKKGEIVSIVGASGAGKTTLLHILGTLDKIDQQKDNTLLINDTDISSLNDKSLAKFRNDHIGFIFQFHQLLPEFSALENVCIPAFINGKNQIDAEKRAKEKAAAAKAAAASTAASSGWFRMIARTYLKPPTQHQVIAVNMS